MSQQANRYSYWCFTINNASNEDYPDAWLARARAQCGADYCIWQFEVGEEGTPHIQGYLCCDRRVRLSALKQATGSRGHWEPRRGSHAQARAYCQKSDTRAEGPDAGPFEWGDDSAYAVAPGARTDIQAVRDAIDQGASDAFIGSEWFGHFLRYNRGIALYRALQAPRRTEPPRVVVIVGDTGVGKSYAANLAGEDAYWLRQSAAPCGWWDSYQTGQPVIIDGES